MNHLDIDRLVAEKVMCLPWVPHFQPSTRMDDALEAAEQFPKFQITKLRTKDARPYRAQVMSAFGTKQVNAETAPKAISLAVLLAVGVTVAPTHNR